VGGRWAQGLRKFRQGAVYSLKWLPGDAAHEEELLAQARTSLAGVLGLLEYLERSGWTDGSATVLRSTSSNVAGTRYRIELSLHLSSTAFLSVVTLRPKETRELTSSSVAAVAAALRPLGYRLLTGMPKGSHSFRRRLKPNTSLGKEGEKLLRTLRKIPSAPKGFRPSTEPAGAVSRRRRVPERSFRRALEWCAVAPRQGWEVGAIGRSKKRKIRHDAGEWGMWVTCYLLPSSREFWIGLSLWSPPIGAEGWRKLKRSGFVRSINGDMARLELAGSWFRGPHNAPEWGAAFDRMTKDSVSIEAECRRLEAWTFPKSQGNP
jgi:hypothetical protein